VDLDPRHSPFVVSTVSGDVEALGTVFSVSADGAWGEVHLVEGRLRLRPIDGEPFEIRQGTAATLTGSTRPLETEEAGQTLALLGLEGAPPPPEEATSSAPEERDGGHPHEALPRRHRPDPAALLDGARQARARGDIGEAVRLYEELQRRYPASAEARAALVALGQVHPSPAAALRAFDTYLDTGGGALAHEALYGRIRALRALGRQAEAAREGEVFLRRFPTSPYATTLRDLADEDGQ
jgi:hypothetical protein